jgi:hypothetical protein
MGVATLSGGSVTSSTARSWCSSVVASRYKAASLRDLATKTLDGTVVLSPHGLSRLSDEELKARLTALRGIGPWTADMFLLFQLRRLDVWPTGDFGVRRSDGLTSAIPTPSATELEVLGDPYRPVVAWYCSPQSFTPPPTAPWPPDRERSLAAVAPRGYPQIGRRLPPTLPPPRSLTSLPPRTKRNSPGSPLSETGNAEDLPRAPATSRTIAFAFPP